MAESPEKIAELIRLLQNTKNDEIDCDVFFEKMAELADMPLPFRDSQFKLYQHHLDLCPGCAESLALLKTIIDENAPSP